jgi:NDP-sugar pyrophosphorylase family protein
MSINLIMPMGGAGTRFANLGYECPKPLIEMGGRHFFEYAADSIRDYCDILSITFVVLKDHIDRFSIDREILKYAPEAKIVVLDHVLNGAVLTCMRGAESIENDKPLIFCDCDLMFRSESLYAYLSGDGKQGFYTPGELQGWLMTFESTDPRFSFVKTDEEGYVTETAEKKAISNRAVCGAYGFADKELFLSFAEKYMDRCPYKEYFMSGVYNLMIEEGNKIGEFPVEDFLSFGTPEEYEKAKDFLGK